MGEGAMNCFICLFFCAEFFLWKVGVNVVNNQTGPHARWFISVYSFNRDMTTEDKDKLEETLAHKQPLDRSKLVEFKGNYTLRTWTTGCYYYDKKVRRLDQSKECPLHLLLFRARLGSLTV